MAAEENGVAEVEEEGDEGRCGFTINRVEEKESDHQRGRHEEDLRMCVMGYLFQKCRDGFIVSEMMDNKGDIHKIVGPETEPESRETNKYNGKPYQLYPIPAIPAAYHRDGKEENEIPTHYIKKGVTPSITG